MNKTVTIRQIGNGYLVSTMAVQGDNGGYDAEYINYTPPVTTENFAAHAEDIAPIIEAFFNA